jgi:hypothetical protein
MENRRCAISLCCGTAHELTDCPKATFAFWMAWSTRVHSPVQGQAQHVALAAGVVRPDENIFETSRLFGDSTLMGLRSGCLANFRQDGIGSWPQVFQSRRERGGPFYRGAT